MNKRDPRGKLVFKSPSTGEYVSEHQYLAEIMVKRKADREGYVLPYKYWNGKGKWANEFRSQVTQSGKILKKFSIRAIMNALSEVKWVYSLRSAPLLRECEKQQLILDNLEKKSIQNVNTNTSSFKGTFSKRRIVDL